jgi:hypothetical protein
MPTVYNVNPKYEDETKSSIKVNDIIHDICNFRSFHTKTIEGIMKLSNEDILEILKAYNNIVQTFSKMMDEM